jgi:hypothetical protein
VTNLKYPVLFNDPGYANTTQFAGLPIAVELLANYFIFQPFQPSNENSLPATSAPNIDGSGGTSAVGNNGWVEVVQADGSALTEAGYVRGNTRSVWTRQDTGTIGVSDGFWAYTDSQAPRISVYAGAAIGDGTQAQEQQFYKFASNKRNFFFSQVFMNSGGVADVYGQSVLEAEFFYGLATTASSSDATVTVLSGTTAIDDYMGFHKPNGESKVYFACGNGNATATLTSQTYEDTGWDFASTGGPATIPLGFLSDKDNTIYVYAPLSPQIAWEVPEPRLASIVSTNVPESDRMRPTIAIRRTATTDAGALIPIVFQNYVLGMQLSSANYTRRP